MPELHAEQLNYSHFLQTHSNVLVKIERLSTSLHNTQESATPRVQRVVISSLEMFFANGGI
jgi:hypothetical protein